MLKALEVCGFKSFADKTRFEFPPGITVVVGPNGSGKSNIVDAIKWVLGEQSARSLRGKEMADVIFKGSGNGQRKPSATAEATIIFDNATSLLSIDAPEVHVTRRVYRSGEGEYLINGQPCRLKDIKQLFRGTGVGTDAYSIIEQGKVDTLLQASPKDRRAIFEEAAGISRFNAKKVEAERRLERVEQNLVRLADIVEEVDGRLRRLKSQAGKARRFKEYSDRLQQLRTHVGLVDWRQTTERMVRLEAERRGVDEEAERTREVLFEGQARLDAIEAERDAVERAWQAAQSHCTEARERAITLRTVIEQRRPHLAELDDESIRGRGQAQELRRRIGGGPRALAEAEAEFARADEARARLAEQASTCEARRSSIAPRLIESRAAAEQAAARERAALAEIADVRQEHALHTAALSAATAAQAKLAQRLADTRRDQEALEDRRRCLELELADADAALEILARELDAQRADTRTHLELQADLDQRWTGLLKRQLALGERVAFLREIETRREGIGLGTQEVLRRAREEPAGPFGSVEGLVADVIQVVDRDYAEMIAAALGDRAEHLVATDILMSLCEEEGLGELPARVGIVLRHSLPPPEWTRPAELDGVPGVLGRADQFVESAAKYENLVQWLLSDTWLVEDLPCAIRLSRELVAPARFVTRQGEVVERDGRLLLGPPRELGGVISRRAELRDLERQLEEIQAQLTGWEQHTEAVKREARTAGEILRRTEAREGELRLRTGSLRTEQLGLGTRLEEVRGRVEEIVQEQASLAREAETSASRLAATEGRCRSLEETASRAAELLAAHQAELRRAELELEISLQELGAVRSELAASERQVDSLRRNCEHLRSEAVRVERESRALEERNERTTRRRAELELEILQAAAESHEWTLRQEESSELLAARRHDRDLLAEEAQKIQNGMARFRQIEAVGQRRWHELELELERLRLERESLATRIQEDYGIQLAALEATPSAEELEARDEIDREILDLRQKLSTLGAVNMDALEELEELDSRYTTLHAQYQDLVTARESLLKIIQRINVDSRRLFAETLEKVRGNFQVLFRKVFGGGRADIVLEDGIDILEAGIDVVATPPGKHSLGLSLLSGGERALTAVTLLMAIFQYRPSPFCVLDEVDGPLDEANIGRFVDVLKEFLQWTKFVVVTHSKRTMTAAHTLYGVTMQESGVSKRVSVRFEDVNERGEISADAVNRSLSDDERGAA